MSNISDLSKHLGNGGRRFWSLRPAWAMWISVSKTQNQTNTREGWTKTRDAGAGRVRTSEAQKANAVLL